MTEPGKQQADGTTAEQPAADQQMTGPSVRTAPARSGPFSRVPAHLGRARTSTVVLGLLFVAIFALYLTIKPADPGTASTTTTDTEVVQPVPTTTAPETTAPETSAEPTTSAPLTTTSAPTTSPESTTSEPPTDTTVPQETAQPTLPTFSAPSTRGSTPTLGSPPG